MQLVQDRHEGAPERRERVVYARRHLRIDLALYQTVALEIAQLSREHFRGDAFHRALQLAETLRAVHERAQNDDFPFIAD